MVSRIKGILRILTCQNGAAFLVAMLILMLLTFMGTFALMTTDIEIQIAANEKNYLKEFYVSDSAWKETLPWLNNRETPPHKVNESLGDDMVKNYGGGGDGVLNDTFPEGSEDGSLSGVPYWNRVEYVSDTIVPGSGKDYRRFHYLVTSNGGGHQEIEVTISKIYKVGY